MFAKLEGNGPPGRCCEGDLAGGEAEVVSRLGEARVLPVATIDDGDQAGETCRALIRGGLVCIEITFRTRGAVEAIRRAREVEGMLVGAGTVLSPEQARAAATAGAQFAVSPGLNVEVVEAAQQLELPFFPGVATATEIEQARALGLRVVKVFPAASVGSVGFLRAVSATYPDVRFIPTGGIGPGTLAEYLAVPSVLAVGGSWLVSQDLLRAARYDEVTRLACEVMAVIS